MVDIRTRRPCRLNQAEPISQGILEHNRGSDLERVAAARTRRPRKGKGDRLTRLGKRGEPDTLTANRITMLNRMQHLIRRTTPRLQNAD